ncbi:MAG: TIGR03792 family protein [Acidimicrobiales bacterium]
MAQTWRDEAKVGEYLGRVDRLAARAAGEAELVDALPDRVHRVLDLGCGDGRLIELVLGARPATREAIGLDISPPMLDRARERFAERPHVRMLEHDLRDPLPDLGVFDVVVSGFAIHHLTHERKRTLFDEIVPLLRPGGVFANLEVVACATPELQAEFEHRIGRPGGDPEDVLACVDEQLSWMRRAGLQHVDCAWRWRGFALLTGRSTGAWVNTKQVHPVEPPYAIEQLVFEVRTDRFDDWAAAEHQIWTHGLADRFPGYVDRETWVQDLGEWRRVSIVIAWRTLDEWMGIDTDWLADVEQALVDRVGADTYRLVHAGHETGAHWFKVSEYR